MTNVDTRASFDADRSAEDSALPETVRLTGAVIRTWRAAGYRLSEVRRRNWLYLQARSAEESAVYKIIGPRFDGATAVYEGWRIA